VQPDQVNYVEAHGTGTRLGDPIEVQALAAAFGPRPEDRPLWIGSVKSNIGHLEAAAGMAGLIKVVLALNHGEIPRHLNCVTPSPHIPWANLSVRVVQASVPWPADPEGKPRLAGISSFGFSGTNAHVLVEEAPLRGAPIAREERPLHLLTLSARSRDALKELATRYAAHSQLATESLAEICYTASTGRGHFEERLALVARTREQLATQLTCWTDGQQASDLIQGSSDNSSVKLAGLFPAEGLEYIGMGRQLFETQPTFRMTIRQCEEILRADLPHPLSEALFQENGLLERTEFKLPALFTLEFALAQLWGSWGLLPDVLLGQGVGEYVAACVAGILSLKDGLKLAVERARLLNDSSPPDSAFDLFERATRTIDHRSPQVEFLCSMTGQLLKAGNTLNQAYWRAQSQQPFTLAPGLHTLAARGNRLVLEFGPHPTMADARFVSLPSLQRGMEDWKVILSSLAQVYVTGGSVDWIAFDRDYTRRKVSLPTYPFQRQRYWMSVSSSQYSGTGSHPLLGPPRRSPVQKDVTFDATWSTRQPCWLGDHRVNGGAVVPATAYLEAALAAASMFMSGHSIALEHAEFQQALALPESGSCSLQLVWTPAEAGSGQWRIYSQQGENWTLHAHGHARVADPMSPTMALQESLARCPETVSLEAFRAHLRSLGLEYGPCFQGLIELRRGTGEAVSRIDLPEELNAERHSYTLHPALLDACLQTCMFLVPDAGVMLLPFSIDLVQVQQVRDSLLWCHAQTRPDSTAATPAFDLQITDDAGQAVGNVIGLRLRPGTPGRNESVHISDWFCRLSWHEQVSTAASCLLGPEALARELDTAPANSGRYLSALNDAATGYALAALAQLGMKSIVGETVSPSRLPEIAPQHYRLVNHLCMQFEAAGFLRRSGDEWIVARPWPVAAPERQLMQMIDKHPEASIEAGLLQRVGTRLAEVLRGKCDPLALLFPPGEELSAAALYRDAPETKAFNAMLAEVVARAAARLPEGCPVRILELGAGTGSTTAALLARLPPSTTRYTFTDLSAGFFAPAREEFAAYPFVDYRILDIERDPQSQGLPHHGFDVVLAANVLHATADLRTVVRHVRKLLAPAGMLVLLEATPRQRWLDLVFGLLEGWWKFTDGDLRPNHPLLPAAAWERLLQDEGFEQTATLPAGADAGQNLVLARAPTEPVKAAPGRYLIFADPTGIGADLRRRLADSGCETVLVDQGAGFKQITDYHYCLNTSSNSDFEQMLEVVVRHGPLRAVVYLGALGEAECSSTACTGLLHLVQALARSDLAPRLLVATNGTQAVVPADRVDGLTQAPLWGLARVVANEHPELKCTCIDLEGNVSPDRASEQLFFELTGPDAAAQIAYRDGQRLVAHLTESAETLAIPPGHFRLEVAERGDLDSLCLGPFEPQEPEPGQISVAVHAAGLNFRDVLNVLGMYPGEVGPPGHEFAGRITAAGAGTRLEFGTEVVGFGTSCIADTVNVVEDLVGIKPRRLSMEQAAGVPTVFVTAALALEELARLQEGERILIHAAAGGVGLAAIQLAQQVGAEVFATASQAKHAALLASGVHHVSNSRSTDFVEDVLRRTDGRGVDVVLNSLSGEFIPASLRVLAPGGRFVEIGKRGIWNAAQVAAQRPDVTYHVLALDERIAADPVCIGALLREILQRFDAGQLQPVVRAVHPLTEAASAFRIMQQARHTGKIVLRVPRELPKLLRQDSSYLITGGLGGLGLATAQRLIERGARHLVLLGRNPPSESAHEVIAGLEHAGAEVLVLQADVSVAADVAAALEQIARRLPPLHGVIHAAGVLDDGVLLNQTSERFARVLAAKVEGAWNLHRLTMDLPLDFFVLYSSMAALLGPAGQGNHAAANAFLDALAHHRRARGLPAQSINWGAWGEVG
ncbi:MAG: SDR family NAD(P)-dependent oxidoreductase, partial [Gemmataceae bacterium]